MNSGRSVFFTLQALYQAMSSILHSPLGHQVTQEEVFICPSHTAVLANYSDLMCTLAGICGDARCYCINSPAPSVAFIILNRLSSFVGAVFLCKRKPHCTGMRCDIIWAVGLALVVFVDVCNSIQPFHPSPTCPCVLKCNTYGN